LSGSDDLLGDLVAKARQGARGETGALELLEKGERMFHMKRNKKTVAILTVGLLTVAGGAYAYWTSTGTGTGDATTASSDSTLSVTQVLVPTDMAPGVAAGAITFNVKNNSTTQSAQVMGVAIAITNVTQGSLVGPACTAGDYNLTQPTWIPVNLAASATSANNATATLGFKPTAVNQDKCQGAVVTLVYTAS